MSRTAIVLAAIACVGCNSGKDVPVRNMTVPDLCGGQCGTTQICRANDVGFGLDCEGPVGPILCDAGPDAAGKCSKLCVQGQGCEAPPDGCSATDCECIIKKMCPTTNQVGEPCGGFCSVIHGHAQVDCLGCS